MVISVSDLDYYLVNKFPVNIWSAHFRFERKVLLLAFWWLILELLKEVPYPYGNTVKDFPRLKDCTI